MDNRIVNSFQNNNRGASAVFGYVMIFAIVLAVISSLLIFGLPFVGEGGDIRGDAVFDYNVTENNEFGIDYIEGDDFRQADTEELRIVNHETNEEYVIGDYPIEQGDVVVEPGDEDVPEDLFDTGETVQFIFVANGGASSTIDTVTFPTTDQLGTTDIRDSGDAGISGEFGVS